MSLLRVANRYAKSLIDLAKERGSIDQVLEDVHYFNEVCKNRDFELMLKSPIVNADKKEQVFDKLFSGKFDELTMAFLKILLKKGREPLLALIGKEFVAQYKKLNHITTVQLTTASPLSDETVEAIRQKLLESKATDQKVELRTSVNPDLIGGFVVQFDDELYDASVAHKLALLKKEFKDNLYISQIIER
ncbi:MAG TPA: ATP synthase F1 subunit delta [Bacteroidetes bacterium]|nr:ATP synthase F1 subunit delta [Bacteroidota bacterium]